MAAMENHITSPITHFGTGCYSWDVVNEALNGDGSFTFNGASRHQVLFHKALSDAPPKKTDRDLLQYS